MLLVWEEKGKRISRQCCCNDMIIGRVMPLAAQPFQLDEKGARVEREQIASIESTAGRSTVVYDVPVVQ
jgi:hypothetical protein